MQICYHDMRRRGLTGCLKLLQAASHSSSANVMVAHMCVATIRVGTLQFGPELTSVMQDISHDHEHVHVL